MLTPVFTDFQSYATQCSKNRENASFRLIILVWCLESLRPSLQLCCLPYSYLFSCIFTCLASSSASFDSLDNIPHFRPYSHVTLEFHPGIGNLHCLSLALFFKGCLDGDCEEKKYNARYSQQLLTGTGRRASFKTVPPPRDRLSLRGQSELISWWFVPDHIHGTSSSTPMSQYNCLALAVTDHASN